MTGLTLLASPLELALAAGGAAAAWLAALLLERRRSRGGATGRLGLLAVALLALVALQARPARPTAVAPSEAVLLTPGATAADVAAAVGSGARLWAVPGRAGEPALPTGAPPAADAATLARRHPEVEALHVVGHGLTAAEWESLPLPADAAPPPALPLGVRRLAWPRQLPLGAALRVAGEVASVPAAGATVSLAGAGLAASTPVAAGARAAFTLAGTPRASGRHLLTLRVSVAGAPPVEETLEVEVLPARAPAVLWIEDAPSLESRELGHWLREAGATFAVRSRLSRGVVREQVVGSEAPLRLGVLTAALLGRFDLVVADAGGLAALGGAEREALRRAVEDGGAGLLVRPEEGAATSVAVLGRAFGLRGVAGASRQNVRLRWPGRGEAPELALPARQLAPAADAVPLASDVEGRLLAAWRQAGAGAVAVSLVDATWRWVREGNTGAHRRYWSEVLRVLSRPTEPAGVWRAAAGPALVDRPLALALDTTAAAPAVTVTGPGGPPATPGLRQDLHEPARWTTTSWPRAAGWHEVDGGGARLGVWAAPPHAWATLRLAERQEATADRVARAAAPAPRPRVERLTELPRWPWFALFLVAVGLLWGTEAWRRSAPAAPAPG